MKLLMWEIRSNLVSLKKKAQLIRAQVNLDLRIGALNISDLRIQARPNWKQTSSIPGTALWNHE